MKRISKIILYNDNRILLQLRDNNPNIPYPNTWTLFGGSILEGESPEETLKREISEELGFSLTRCSKLFTKNRNQDGVSVEDNIFTAKVPEEILNQTLREGQKMQFFSLKELEKINVFIPFKEYILDFLSSQN